MLRTILFPRPLRWLLPHSTMLMSLSTNNPTWIATLSDVSDSQFLPLNWYQNVTMNTWFLHWQCTDSNFPLKRRLSGCPVCFVRNDLHLAEHVCCDFRTIKRAKYLCLSYRSTLSRCSALSVRAVCLGYESHYENTSSGSLLGCLGVLRKSNSQEIHSDWT